MLHQKIYKICLEEIFVQDHPQDFSNIPFIAIAKRVLTNEAEALRQLVTQINESFSKACQLILKCQGRIIVTGMGKSGHIGQKIAASFTSIGISSHFLHPAEGFHGDLGIVHRQDLLLALSFSGETEEIIDLLSFMKYIEVSVIAITSRQDSTLANLADVVLLIGKTKEADTYNLVPTTSTTLTLAIGDALTVALMEARGFTPEDFAVYHPRGMLGKKLTLRVQNLLQEEFTNPIINENDTFAHALRTITHYKLGGTSIVNDSNELVGIITDGDIRRILENFANQGISIAEVMAIHIKNLMTQNPVYVTQESLAYDALKLMENHKPRPIFIIPVVNHMKKPVGMLHLHALVQAGFKVNS